MILGLVLTATGVLVVAIYAIDLAYTAAANRMRATHQVIRALDRAAYWRLHHRYTALCSAGVTVEQAATWAEQLTCPDEPIPYDVDPAYLPVWTDAPGTPAAEYSALVEAARRVRKAAV